MSSKKSKLLESAQKNIKKGLYERAIAEYRELIRIDPADVRHQQRLAELLTKIGRKDEAVKEYNALAKHYIDNIHYVKAIAVYKQVQKLEPANADICLTLASLNEKLGLAGNAAAEYTTAIQIYEKNGENLKALKVLESMLAIDPKNFAIRLRIAEKYFSTGNESKSFDEFLSLAKSLKELNDENGLNHVIERTTKIFPQRKGELLAAVTDRAEEPAAVTPVPPSRPAAPSSQPVPAVKQTPVAQQTAAPVKQEPAAPVKQEPATPVRQEPVAPVRQAPAAPVKQQPAPLVSSIELPADNFLELPDEAFIAELADDDLVEELIPIADLEEVDEPDAEFPPTESEWEEEIDMSELEAVVKASVSGPEKIEKTLPPETAYEEIHELEELELEEHDLELEEMDEQESEDHELAGPDIELELEIEPESFDQAETGMEPTEAEVSQPEIEQADSTIDLAGELSLFADEIDFDVMKADGADEKFSMDSFASYTKGDLDKEDSESHYSLGLAYKEMSLFDDAIAEFSVASRSPERKIDCFILQALCFRESGKVAAAIMLLNQTLEEPGITENQLVSIKYELALCQEEAGEQLEAKRLYSEIVTLRPDFGDAVTRLSRL